MSKPDIVTSFEYNGETILLDWFDISDKAELDAINWQQVYVIGNVGGKVPIVQYPEADHKDNLPGGHVEAGETVEQALVREVAEETNMRVLDWQPIGYQKLTEPDGTVVFQLRVYAELEPIGEFVRDPGGNVIGHSLIAVDDLNRHIHYGDVGERMIKLVRDKYPST